MSSSLLTLPHLIRSRVLMLDGAMATELRKRGLSEEQFRGERFATHPCLLKDNYDILSLTFPEAVEQVHRSYLLAGADIIRTNTFAANSISQRRFAVGPYIRELNLSAANIARREADRVSTHSRPRFVAGTMGPLDIALSRLPAPDKTPAMITDAYAGQAQALIDGGVDLIVLETIYDAPSALAALAGIRRAFSVSGVELPVVLSLTVSGSPASLASGHTTAEFLSMLGDFRPFAVGFNCCSGPTEALISSFRSLRTESPYPVVFYPSAGIPDAEGFYPLTPSLFASSISPLIKSRVVNIVGGCCGTTPSHIHAIARLLESDPDLLPLL